MTDKRLQEIENSFFKADRKKLIAMAKELGAWIGDLDDMDDDQLSTIIDEGITAIKDKQWALDQAKGTIQTKDDILDILYLAKKSYTPRSKALREPFAEALSEFFIMVRYSDFPDFSGTEWFYSIHLDSNSFEIWVSRWEGDDSMMGVASYAAIVEKEVNISEKKTSFVYAFDRGYVGFYNAKKEKGHT